MTVSPLPLQNLLLRSTVATLENRIKTVKFPGTTKETTNEVVNPNTFSWDVQFKPLTLTDKNTILNFLLGVGYSQYFYFDVGCSGTVITYTTRIVKDSLKVTRKQAKYYITFSITEEIYTLPVVLLTTDTPTTTLVPSIAEEGTNVTVTITNYNAAFIYDISVAGSQGGGSFIQAGAGITWTLPSGLTSNTTATMTLYATESGKYKSLAATEIVTATQTVTVIEDQALIYNSASMSNFIDFANMSGGTELVASSIDTTNIASSTSSANTLEADVEYIEGDLLNIDGTDFTVGTVSFVPGTVESTDTLGDGSLINKYLLNDTFVDIVSTDNGTKQGSGAFTTGVYGKGYELTVPSRSNYISTPARFPNGAFTLSCWVNTEANTTNGPLLGGGNGLIGTNTLVSQPGLLLFIRPDFSVSLQILSNGSGNRNKLSSAITSMNHGSWYHIVWSFSGVFSTGSQKLYINSVSQTFTEDVINGTFNLVPQVDLTLCQLWGIDDNYYGSFKGILDQVEIYNKALSQAEIATIYAQQVDKYIADTTPVTSGATPANAYINESRALSTIVTQDGGDTDFERLISTTGVLEPFEALFDLTTIDTSSTANTLITDTPIANGDNLAIVLADNSVNVIVASGVTGSGTYTMDTTATTAGETPSRTYVLDAECKFSLSAGYVPAVKASDVFNTSNLPVLRVARSYNNLIDLTGTREINTKVVLKSAGDKLLDLRTTITKKP